MTHLVSPAGMGFGDVKAGAVIGAAVGLVDPQLAALALVLGLAGSAGWAAVRRRRTIPLGPGSGHRRPGRARHGPRAGFGGGGAWLTATQPLHEIIDREGAVSTSRRAASSPDVGPPTAPPRGRRRRVRPRPGSSRAVSPSRDPATRSGWWPACSSSSSARSAGSCCSPPPTTASTSSSPPPTCCRVSPSSGPTCASPGSAVDDDVATVSPAGGRGPARPANRSAGCRRHAAQSRACSPTSCRSGRTRSWSAPPSIPARPRCRGSRSVPPSSCWRSRPDGRRRRRRHAPAGDVVAADADRDRHDLGRRADRHRPAVGLDARRPRRRSGGVAGVGPGRTARRAGRGQPGERHRRRVGRRCARRDAAGRRARRGVAGPRARGECWSRPIRTADGSGPSSASASSPD